MIKADSVYDNEGVGTIVNFPEGCDLNNMKGEQIVYARLIKPDYSFYTDYPFFIISKNASGQYRASQFNLNISGGTLMSVRTDFRYVPMPDFDETCKVTALDGVSFGGGYVYYSSLSNADNLMVIKRGYSGISAPELYHSFGSPIVGLDQGLISRTSKTIGLATADKTFRVLNLAKGMDSYLAPEGDDANSLSYEWKMNNEILFVDYRYGNGANY